MSSHRPDRIFLVLLAIIVVFGLVMLTSASGPAAYQKFNDTYWYIKHQLLMGLVPGIILFLAAARVDYRFWRRKAAVMLLLSIGFLLLVFVPGLAAPWGAARSWVSIGGFSFQPSEVVKLTTLFYIAALFERSSARMAGASRDALAPLLLALGVVAGLIMLQPDLGTLLVIAAMAFILYFLAGNPWQHLALTGAAGAALFFFLVRAAPYRAARLTTFLHPELDPQGIGYHINQAFLAIGSGGFFGLGLGHSRQKFLYLPEAVGDSIFAVTAEELGFFVTLAAIAVFAAFLMRGLVIASRAPDEFGKFVAAGIVAWIFVQTLFNIGSMVGILPLTGLPLPFVSYGGTAMTVLLFAMGVMTNISMQAHSQNARR